jgi:FkbM family methyltransferase
VRQGAFRLASRYKSKILNKLLPFKTVEIDGLKFRYLRGDWPPHDPKNFPLGIEFHDRVTNISGEVAVDVGANIGSYTLPLARNFRKVIAFEPSNTYCDVLRRNIALNGLRNVHVYQMALSDVDGQVPLYVRHGGSSSLSSNHYGLPFDNLSYVHAGKLDGLSSSLGHLDFIKVDAEGHELSVLSGAAQILSRLKPTIAIEVHNARDLSCIPCGCQVCKMLTGLEYDLKVTGEYSTGNPVHWVWASQASRAKE